MINRKETGLEIFDTFSIDTTLPKHILKQDKEGNLRGNFGTPVSGGSFIDFNELDGMVPTPSNVSVGGDMTSVFFQRDNRNNTLIYTNKKGWMEQKKDNLWLRAKVMWRFLMSKDFKREIVPAKITVQEYFRSIKMSCEELQKLDDRMNGYVVAVKQADEFGQKALAEDLKARIEVIKLESRMYSMGLVKVITEEQVVDFYKDSEKGVQLNWIRNFNRVIPSALLSLKKRADELEIFDNYVIMHYDPNKKSYKQTKEEYEAQKAAEEAKRRDPIMFGVLKDSRKLYYVG